MGIFGCCMKKEMFPVVRKCLLCLLDVVEHISATSRFATTSSMWQEFAYTSV